MKVGDLVKNIYTKELGLVTSFAVDNPEEYVEVSGKRLIPVEHLKVISESR
jgi:hypothetical protein